MKWFLQFLSLGSAVLYTLLVTIDNRIPDGIANNTVASEAHSNQSYARSPQPSKGVGATNNCNIEIALFGGPSLNVVNRGSTFGSPPGVPGGGITSFS